LKLDGRSLKLVVKQRRQERCIGSWDSFGWDFLRAVSPIELRNYARPDQTALQPPGDGLLGHGKNLGPDTRAYITASLPMPCPGVVRFGDLSRRVPLAWTQGHERYGPATLWDEPSH
jgi:hypothetical protein